jgi:ribokinase
MPRVAVVGHVEWITFARVPRLPAAGEIVHASETWEQAGGGGAVAVVQLARLAGGADFFTALGSDVLARRCREQLEAEGVRVHGAPRPEGQRRCFTHIDAAGERTITVVGDRIVPHGEDALEWDELAGFDAVYFTAGDDAALRAARAARVLTATPRADETLRSAGIGLDVLIRSAGDPGEQLDPAGLDPPPRLVVSTEGADGGRWEAADGTSGRYPPVAPPGPPRDSYGLGDCFAAGLTYGLGDGRELEAALDLAARCGAHKLAGRAAYEGMLSGA